MSDVVSIALLLVGLAGISLYIIINRRTPSITLEPGPVDKYVPFVPTFVVPYLLLFPFLLFTLIILWPTEYRDAFLLSCTIAAWTGGLTWFLLPLGIRRPEIVPEGIASHIVAWIYRIDANTTTFPSAHVYFALIAAFFLTDAFPAFSPLWWILGLLISISTVFVKQHYVVDFVAGSLWAAGSIGLALFFLA